MTNPTLLDTLLEVQGFDRVPRMGYVLRGVALPESVAAHSWQVAFLVWILAPRITGLDVQRAMELALLHDLAELRIGDIPKASAHYFPDGAKKTAEATAFAEILAPLGERANELSAEYSAALTPEARLVKACDKLQLMLRVFVYEKAGERGLGEFWENDFNFPDGGFAQVREMFDELRRRREASR
jgi:putative hydrolase of HD superfamily